MYIIPIFLFIGTFLIYKNIYPEPRNWLDHHLYLAKSLMTGQVSVDNIPEFYQDVNSFDSHKYLPFPPGAAFALIPFIIFKSDISEQFVSIILGAINVAAVFVLLKKFANLKNAVMLSVFLAFGTVHFWVSLVGTSWNFSHIVSFLFLTVSILLSLKSNKFSAFGSGVFFALAGLTRLTVITGGLFFLINYRKNKINLLLFLIGASIFIPVFFGYNYLRFGKFLETGYLNIYDKYVNGGYAYSIQRIWFPDSRQPKYMDFKSIPYHLYTFLIMPPEVIELNVFRSKPSPFGMGILFISPLLFLVFKKFSRNIVEVQAWLGIIPIALLTFCHYAQGWVQFGYRFSLDFLPFLMLILALKFKPTKLNIFLGIVSIFMNYWGTNWAIKLGW